MLRGPPLVFPGCGPRSTLVSGYAWWALELGVFEIQLCQCEVLAERGDTPGLAVHELLSCSKSSVNLKKLLGGNGDELGQKP